MSSVGVHSIEGGSRRPRSNANLLIVVERPAMSCVHGMVTHATAVVWQFPLKPGPTPPQLASGLLHVQPAFSDLCVDRSAVVCVLWLRSGSARLVEARRAAIDIAAKPALDQLARGQLRGGPARLPSNASG